MLPLPPMRNYRNPLDVAFESGFVQATRKCASPVGGLEGLLESIERNTLEEIGHESFIPVVGQIN